MLEVIERRIKFALSTLKAQQDYCEKSMFVNPPWLDSAIYQLELALTDIAGYRLAHGGSHGKGGQDVKEVSGG